MTEGRRVAWRYLCRGRCIYWPGRELGGEILRSRRRIRSYELSICPVFHEVYARFSRGEAPGFEGSPPPHEFARGKMSTCPLGPSYRPITSQLLPSTTFWNADFLPHRTLRRP